MAAITISRQLGSGGATIARTVAQDLGFHLLDRELVDRVADHLQGSSQSVAMLDEHHFGWASSLIFSVIQGLRGQAVTPETYNFVAANVIREAAATEQVVILGRGAQVVLGKEPGTFHVHVMAAPDVRAARIAERDGVDPAEARRRIRDSDEERSEFVRSLGSQRDWEDPLLYDVILNTDRLSPTSAAGVVVAAARSAGVA